MDETSIPSTRAPSAPDLTIAAVIPLYNGAPFIEAALNSVLAQILPASEIIVVDDGSTDNGPGLVERMAANHPITLIRKENGGQGSARNLGVRHASSRLVAFLDQDDMWYPNHLSELAAPFRSVRYPELGWVYSNLDEVDIDGFMVTRGCLDRKPEVEHPKRSLTGCLMTDMFVLPTSSLISREAFERVGGFDERLVGYEDDDLFLRLFRHGYDSVYLPRALSKWRIYSSSASFSSSMGRSRMIYFRKLIETFARMRGETPIILANSSRRAFARNYYLSIDSRKGLAIRPISHGRSPICASSRTICRVGRAASCVRRCLFWPGNRRLAWRRPGSPSTSSS